MVITKYPIILFSSPRVGSSAFGEYIRTQFDNHLLYFREPDFYGVEKINEFLNLLPNINKFLLKVHLYKLPKYEPYAEYLSYDPRFFRIRLMRKDAIKQAVSLYITESKNKLRNYVLWNPKINGPGYKVLLNEVQPLMIDEDVLLATLRRVHDMNSILTNSDITFDLDLYFEDVLPLMQKTVFVEYPKPANYQEILDTARRLYSTLDLG